MITAADRDFIRQRLGFYGRHLREDVLPWWMDNAIDEECGGVFTYWDGSGHTLKLRTEDKYVWSQGRWGWTTAMLARLADARPDLKLDADRLKRSTLATAELLWSGAVLPDGTCASIITRQGQPIERVPGGGFHDSVYADLFVSLTFAAAETLVKDGVWGQRSLDLAVPAEARIRQGKVRTEPYIVPEGFDSFALNMILLNTGAELFAMTGDARAAGITERAAATIRHDFANGSDMCELRPLDPALDETLDARHRNPGHVIEGLWMYRQAADLLPSVAAIDPDCNDWLSQTLCHMCQLGWDDESGGLLRFVDREGGPPQGTNRGSLYEGMVTSGWDRKLWWPHNEALYAALQLWLRTGNSAVGEWYRRLDDYTFTHFPAGPGLEWNQILDRRGNAMAPDARAALPVKDPYHLLRSLFLLLELDPEFDSHP
ncbi:MAG TPA: AGE family epimerase/isomerase [Devosia sp.]|nr:AGE family epimerase/isomerase [Devosia sp.]